MKEKKWVTTAIEAQRRLDAEDEARRRSEADILGWEAGWRHGERPSVRGRLSRIHDIAQDMGIRGATLRNYLIALEGLRSVRDDRAAALLAQHSAVSVAAFCRWVNREPNSAYRFLFQNPKAPLNELLSAERAQRINRYLKAGQKPRPELDEALISQISAGPRFSQALGSPGVHLGSGAKLWAIIPPRYRFAGLDELILPDRDADPQEMGHFTLAGIIRLPRLAILDDYGKRSKEIWWRASSASAHCPLVLVVFPGLAARRRFLSALPEPIEPESSFAGLAQAPRAGTGSTLRPIYFRSGPGHGLIVITSPITLLRDLAS